MLSKLVESIYGSPIFVAVTTIALSLFFFHKLARTRSPQKDRNDQDSRDKPSVERQQLPGDEGPISGPLHAISELQTVGSSNALNKGATRDDNPDTSIASHTAIDHPVETRNESDHDIPISTEIPPVIPEHPPIDNKGMKGRNKETTDEVDNDLPIPTEPLSSPSTAVTNPRPIVRRDADMTSEEAPPTSMTLFQGSSNFQITNTNINAIGGNATIIRFGDGQFTEIQRNLICDYIANLTVLPDINTNLRKHILTQSIISLPRAEAVFDDYQTKRKSGPCFEGTRVALLREMADWATSLDEPRMYVLSGLAGIGKSTVAYTMASRASDLNLLAASFFFSRDEADRNNAKRFFTTIAYQLCVYNEMFAKAIGDVLLTERGSAATTKDIQEQLQVLILDPLRSIVQSLSRPILVVVDALDECDEADGPAVVTGLIQLVRVLPSFRVILTTRPQPLVDYLFNDHDDYKTFRLQDIEDKTVDGDIRLYLLHSFSKERVRAYLRTSKGEWYAREEDIESLVRASGRLFIIASTAVLYVLNKTLGDPGTRMKKLLGEIAQDRTPFHTLNHFYSIIVRSAIQADEDDNDIVDRFQIIVGTIVVIQTPLPITSLACFVGEEPENIYAMLRNLQSVILLGGDDIPRIYHNSFRDYLTDPARCKDPRLHIDTRIRHTRITIRCFEVMKEHLKYNMLGLGDPARFMNNEDGLKEDGITNEQLQEKFPQQLRYACVHWANHLEVANVEDVDLMNELEKFAYDHLLHWFEVLSLIGKLDSAHHAIRTVLKLLKATSSNLYQLLSDALRFISKFYEGIKQSALHAYYSALPFTPTDGPFYRRYNKEASYNICRIEGGPEKWDALVASLSDEGGVKFIAFSRDSSLFVSYSEGYMHNGIHKQGKLKIWDAVTGTPISTIPGHRFAVTNDLSTVASSEDKTITMYNVNSNTRAVRLTTSFEIQELALSESGRVAAALSDGTVWLWDSKNAELINSFNESEGTGYQSSLRFSPTGSRLAYSLKNGVVKLRDGVSAKFIADLECGPYHRFVFSGNGSRILSLSSDCGLRLWNTESGGLIGVKDVGPQMNLLAISASGSLFATADRVQVILCSENRDSLTIIKVLQSQFPRSIAFSLDNVLVLGTHLGIKLYNVNTHSFISSFFGRGLPIALAITPDLTRLAVVTMNDQMDLWDIRGIDASSPPPKTIITALALSRDCLRLACGFTDGTVELWETNPTKQRIISHQAYKKSVQLLGFCPDGGLFVSSSSDDKAIKLWNGVDGAPRGALDIPGKAMALSNNMLVAAGNEGVTLWSLDSSSLVHTFTDLGDGVSIVSIAENNALIAVFFYSRKLLLLDAVNHTTITAFNLPHHSYTMTFLPDNSQLVAHSSNGSFLSINLIDQRVLEGLPALEHLIQLPNIPLWHGVPIWYCQPQYTKQCYFSALFSQHKGPVPILWVPKEIGVSNCYTQGSSMIAFVYKSERIILLRL